MSPKRIAVFGGTFNPIHNGHIFLVRTFADLLQTDRVLTVVTNVPPHKVSADLADNLHRLAMCRLAATVEPRIEACDIELRREGKSYTCDTLRELHEQNPDAELYFLMGADMFMTLQSWRNPKEIFKYATVCGAPRNETDAEMLRAHAKELEALGAHSVIATVTPPEISSTQIRAFAAAGKPLDGLVPQAVAEYIRANGLYRNPNP